MSTVKEDATQIAEHFIPSVGKLVAAVSLCWSNVGDAGVALLNINEEGE